MYFEREESNNEDIVKRELTVLTFLTIHSWCFSFLVLIVLDYFYDIFKEKHKCSMEPGVKKHLNTLQFGYLLKR